MVGAPWEEEGGPNPSDAGAVYIFAGAPASCCNRAGDANNNNVVNILDVTYSISFLYKGGPPAPCPDEMNANGNTVINILDVTYLIGYLYKSGPAPVCP